MHNVAATFAIGVNDPTPAISGNSAAIAQVQPAALSLSAMIAQYFTAADSAFFRLHTATTK
jgi:hypothetical protein